MNRREFLVAGAAGVMVASAASSLMAQSNSGRGESKVEYYELRQYHLKNADQFNRLQAFLKDALLPVAKKWGSGPVGVFLPMDSADTSTIWTLIPYKNAEAALTASRKMMSDPDYLKAGADFLNSTLEEAGYVRVETSLMVAFDGMPKLAVPANKPRIFEMRVYESHSDKAHFKKMEMFNKEEIAIFHKTGLKPVFFGSHLTGSQMPNLTYMLVFDDMADHDALWKTFGSSPEWQKLSNTPGYTGKETVSHINNMFLRPAPFSQI